MGDVTRDRPALRQQPRSLLRDAVFLGLACLGLLAGVLPPAVRNVLPAMAGLFIVSIKDRSLVPPISLQEPTFMSSEVSSGTALLRGLAVYRGAVLRRVLHLRDSVPRPDQRWKLRT
jgi:ABC-type arginine transport system permease subunit